MSPWMAMLCWQKRSSSGSPVLGGNGHLMTYLCTYMHSRRRLAGISSLLSHHDVECNIYSQARESRRWEQVLHNLSLTICLSHPGKDHIYSLSPTSYSASLGEILQRRNYSGAAHHDRPMEWELHYDCQHSWFIYPISLSQTCLPGTMRCHINLHSLVSMI